MQLRYVSRIGEREEEGIRSCLIANQAFLKARLPSRPPVVTGRILGAPMLPCLVFDVVSASLNGPSNVLMEARKLLLDSPTGSLNAIK
jgi:hypothetical protein